MLRASQSHHDERLCLNRIRYLYDEARGADQEQGSALTRARFEHYLRSVGIEGAAGDMQELLLKLEVDEHGIITSCPVLILIITTTTATETTTFIAEVSWCRPEVRVG